MIGQLSHTFPIWLDYKKGAGCGGEKPNVNRQRLVVQSPTATCNLSAGEPVEVEWVVGGSELSDST